MTQNQSRKQNHQGHLLNQRTDDNIEAMKKTMNGSQFIAFLTGAGGTGKSKVIHSVRHCCKQFCEKQLNIAFTCNQIATQSCSCNAQQQRQMCNQ